MPYLNQANGCYANSFLFAYFLYADDIMLLSPSVLGLQSIHHSDIYNSLSLSLPA